MLAPHITSTCNSKWRSKCESHIYKTKSGRDQMYNNSLTISTYNVNSEGFYIKSTDSIQLRISRPKLTNK